MDQIVRRPPPARPANIEAALSLDTRGRGRKRRRGWLAVMLLLAGAGGAYAGWTHLTAQTDTVVYRTAPAEIGSLTVSIAATGTIQPLTQVEISSELSGVMRLVAVDENQRVAAGDVLAELDTTRLAAQVERAEASLKAAEARVTEASTTLRETQQTLDRTRSLSQRGMVADQVLETALAARDRAESAVETAEANVAVALADLKLQQADLEKSTIYAPIDGIVLTRSVNPGQTVAASTSAPILFVLAENLERMELTAAVDEADIGTVEKGQDAVFTVDAFPERRFDAQIRDIAFASLVTEGVVTYDARLDVDNADLRLRPGMTATVTVITRHAEDVITIPSAAFRYSPQTAERSSGFSFQNLLMPQRMGMRGGGRPDRARAGSPGGGDGARPVYVLRDGMPEQVRVVPGATDGEMTEIVSGLELGDRVVIGQALAGEAGAARGSRP